MLGKISKPLMGLGIAMLSPLLAAAPMNFSYTGSLAVDNEVQLFNFSADGASEVYLVSYGYAGGTQADGTVHTFGGLDTILSLFDSAGTLVNANDDGSGACFSGAEALVPGIDAGNTDPGTGRTYDTCLSSVLAAGDYTVAVSQYDNFANGPALGNGFVEDGNGNFTAAYGCSNGSFCDVAASNRTTAWAFDILNVESADIIDMPIPGTVLLLSLGLAGLGFRRRS